MKMFATQLSRNTRACLGSATLIFGLVGCMTSQENPNYQVSTRYKGAGDNVSVATAPAPAQMETINAVYGDEADQAQTHYYETNQGSTDTQYQGQEVSGTPGYMAMASDGYAASSQNTTASAQSAATAVDYDYRQNLIEANSAAADHYAIETRTYSMSNTDYEAYTVQSGDTVYNLSRQQCVGVDEIQSANGLEADFGIDIGQNINLPASRC